MRHLNVKSASHVTHTTAAVKQAAAKKASNQSHMITEQQAS
jgi:hypothetical protein